MEPRLRSVTEHVERVRALVAPLPRTAVDLDAADGSFVAEDLYAVAAVPPFDSAAMDGYAVRLADLPPGGEPVTLRVAGDVAAGSSGAAGTGDVAGIGPGQAVRIMTGAPLPPGADAVVPVEHTSTGRFRAGAPRTEESVALGRRPRTHVRSAGEDVRAGQLLARTGTEVTAALVGALAASGTVRVPVRRRPRVVVISTGSELVPVGGGLGPGQITDSNGPMLAAAARAAGADVVRLGPVPDDPVALRSALDEAVGAAPDRSSGPGADLIVTAGGVSAGAADVVREVLASPGGGGVATDVDVAGVAMAPGKPQALARWRGVPWLALPGNPVGAYTSFELFARPAIDRLRGLDEVGNHDLLGRSGGPARAEVPGKGVPGRGGNAELALLARRYPLGRVYVDLPAAVAWSSPAGKLQTLPVRLSDGSAAPCGSHHALSALAVADGLALVPPDVEKVRAGDLVRVLMLR